jgi:3-oxoacyl-[acyl-carrier-protein] synthase I
MADVSIVGIGADTPLGASAVATTLAWRAAVSSIKRHPVYLDSRGELVSVSRDPDLSPTLEWRHRIVTLATAAAAEALTAFEQEGGTTGVRLDVHFAMPEPRPGTVTEVERDLVAAMNEIVAPHFAPGAVRFSWQGHAAGLLLVQHAFEKIRAGELRRVLLVGVDSFVCPETLDWLDENKQLKREGRTSGFPPGEAAAAVLLADKDDALGTNAVSLARVVACATAREANRIKTDTVCTGEALTQAIRAALQPLIERQGRVANSFCDLNGERYRSEELMYAIARTTRSFTNAMGYATPADCFGDVGAASGPLYLVMAAVAGARGFASGPMTLAWAGSENGLRSAVLIELPVKRSAFR